MSHNISPALKTTTLIVLSINFLMNLFNLFVYFGSIKIEETYETLYYKFILSVCISVALITVFFLFTWVKKYYLLMFVLLFAELFNLFQHYYFFNFNTEYETLIFELDTMESLVYVLNFIFCSGIIIHGLLVKKDQLLLLYGITMAVLLVSSLVFDKMNWFKAFEFNTYLWVFAKLLEILYIYRQPTNKTENIEILDS